jgi:hypothetical protein
MKQIDRCGGWGVVSSRWRRPADTNMWHNDPKGQLQTHLFSSHFRWKATKQKTCLQCSKQNCLLPNLMDPVCFIFMHSTWNPEHFDFTYLMIRASVFRVIVIVAIGRDFVSVELRPLTDPLSIPQMIHEWIWSSGGMILTGENRKNGRKTCPNATLSIINPTGTDLVASPGLRGEKPATNRLSYGAAVFHVT